MSTYKILHQGNGVFKCIDSIQGTCRLSLKMGRGGEQKTVTYCI